MADTALNKQLRRTFAKAIDSVQFRLTYYNRNDALPEPVVRNRKHTGQASSNPYLIKLQNLHQTLDYKTALLSLQTKTLLLGSAHDYMYPKGYYDFKKTLTKAKVRVHITPNGSHMAMWDDTESYFSALTSFLMDVEKGRF